MQGTLILEFVFKYLFIIEKTFNFCFSCSSVLSLLS